MDPFHLSLKVYDTHFSSVFYNVYLLQSYIFYVILSLVKLLPEEGFELGKSGTIFLT